MMALPQIALSVRQPWAWAIIHGGKDIENRTWPKVNHSMYPLRICIHASKGMNKLEYKHHRLFIEKLGIKCPRPDEFIRGAIIGAVTITAIVDEHDSPWFSGPRGLVLSDPQPIEPIPALGKLGYFKWEQSGTVAEPLGWMKSWPLSNIKILNDFYKKLQKELQNAK